MWKSAQQSWWFEKSFVHTISWTTSDVPITPHHHQNPCPCPTSHVTENRHPTSPSSSSPPSTVQGCESSWGNYIINDSNKNNTGARDFIKIDCLRIEANLSMALPLLSLEIITREVCPRCRSRRHRHRQGLGGQFGALGWEWEPASRVRAATTKWSSCVSIWMNGA